MRTSLAIGWIVLVSAGSTALLLYFFDVGIGHTFQSSLLAAVQAVAYWFANLALLLIMLAAWRRRGLRALLVLLVPVAVFFGLATAWQGEGATWLLRLVRGLTAAVILVAAFLLPLWPVTRIWPAETPDERGV